MDAELRSDSSRVACPADPYLGALQQLKALRQRVQHLHPLLERDFPVAVAEGSTCRVYDVDGEYRLAQELTLPMSVPRGVRAAFPLDSYGGRCVAVVTGEVFDELEGYVLLLHEAVHCYQADTCEDRLKSKLSIAQQARAAGDSMWEIQYPFSYGAPAFASGYVAYLQALDRGQPGPVADARRAVLGALDAGAVEYLVWQEWKEGFARLIETAIRRELGLAENHAGAVPPFDRVSFYEGGARTIAFLETQAPGLSMDIEALYRAMSGVA